MGCKIREGGLLFNHAPTILIYFRGILAFSTTSKRILPARLYTTHLSALIYIQRLLFLEQALPLRSYPTLGIKHRPRTRQLDRLSKTRERYMVIGSQSAFEEFVSLRSYGRAVAQTDTPATLLYWSNDGQTVSWGEKTQMTMGQFRLLPEYLIGQASRLCSELMYSWEPTIDLARMKDKMATADSGYSFVVEPENNLSKVYLQLLKRACTSREEPLCRNERWNWQAVRRYQKKEESFRKYLGLVMHMTGGQLPRWPELLSLWCKNAEFRERGIYVHKGSLVYVARHHKAKRSTNREFIVARFLPAEVAHLVYKYCVYIRPFMNLLGREGRADHGIQESSPLLFRANTASGSKPWQTNQLTKLLKEVTKKVWGYPVHSQLLRQLCIGITEKHVREVHQSFNRFDDTSDKADRNVVFAWQSGHRPLQRAITYGLDGAFPTKLQPQLLELYEWAYMKWHEFLHLPSKLASLPSEGTSSSHRLAWLSTAGQPAPLQAAQRQKRKRKRDDDDEGAAAVAGGSQDATYLAGHGNLGSQSYSTKTKSTDTSSTRTTTSTNSNTSTGSIQWSSEVSAMLLPSFRPEPTPAPVEIEEAPIGQQAITRRQEPLLTQPLFGCLSEAESVGAIQEQRSLVQFLHRYQTTEANRFGRQDQLARVVETVKWWGLVGCQLCFAVTGQRKPDHDIHSCKRGVDSERARLLLRWLEGLDIPLSHHPRRRGDCSICAPFYPCREVAYGVHKAEARSPGRKAYWAKQFKEKPGPDGHCEHRPLIRQAIAALCTYDNQFLGKLLTKLASDRDNLDLSSEVDARKWFEQLAQIPHWRFWNILQIYESLIRAFYFRRNRSLGQEPLCGFPNEPPGDISYTLDLEVDFPSWNDSKEVDRWQASLDWWVGKCSFCAGRGLTAKW